MSFGSGTSAAGSLSSGLSTITGNSRGTDSLQSEGDRNKDAQIDPNKQHREKHPGGYGKDEKKQRCRMTSNKRWQESETSLL